MKYIPLISIFLLFALIASANAASCPTPTNFCNGNCVDQCDNNGGCLDGYCCANPYCGNQCTTPGGPGNGTIANGPSCKKSTKGYCPTPRNFCNGRCHDECEKSSDCLDGICCKNPFCGNKCTTPGKPGNGELANGPSCKKSSTAYCPTPRNFCNGNCIDQCRKSSDCLDGICCKNPFCGNQCTTPGRPGNGELANGPSCKSSTTSGFCPTPRNFCNGNCRDQCRKTSDCLDGVCCKNPFCGNQCTTPGRPGNGELANGPSCKPRTRPCPTPRNFCNGNFKDQCKTSRDCVDGFCCPNPYCGNQCVTPGRPGNGGQSGLPASSGSSSRASASSGSSSRASASARG